MKTAHRICLRFFFLFEDSFCKAQQWLKDLEREFLPGEVVVMLVGNKTDLSEEREVTFEVKLGTGHYVTRRRKE